MRLRRPRQRSMPKDKQWRKFERILETARLVWG
jgi:hypothetical protein